MAFGDTQILSEMSEKCCLISTGSILNHVQIVLIFSECPGGPALCEVGTMPRLITQLHVAPQIRLGRPRAPQPLGFDAQEPSETSACSTQELRDLAALQVEVGGAS